MNTLFTTLCEYEKDALVQALRRDMRHEEQLANSNDPWAEVHSYNARKDKDLLELLEPHGHCHKETPVNFGITESYDGPTA